MQIKYDSVAHLVEAAKDAGQPLSALVLEQQAQQTERPAEELYKEMERMYHVMQESATEGMKEGLRSASGLTGGSAWKMQQAAEKGNVTLGLGKIFSEALARALAVSEWNAAMGRIVASPTAGSCGILPAALLTIQDARSIPEHDCVMALFTASAVGMVIAQNACIAGAQGGCQAECGSASAMAAAALVELCGGEPEKIGHAVAIALKNVLGLVCDPVAGLVEIPCIKRNASGVVNAFVAAELALAGIESAIPPDEVILAMKRVGDAMSPALRETAEGGLAATPTAQKLYQQVFGSSDDVKGCNGCRACH